MAKSLYFLFLSSLCGVLAGTASAIFLILLDLATRTRIAHPEIIWWLPGAGFFIGWVYHRFGSSVAQGNNLVLDEIHNPKKVLPLRMTPFVLLGTVITHLFGGSAGREGTAVQMGASLSDQLGKFLKVEKEERKILLVAGAGAGFGAAIGAPFAGVIFGMEVISVGKLKLFAPLECFVASFVAYYTTLFLKAPHSLYPKIVIPHPDVKVILFAALAGGLFRLAARFFVYITHLVEKAQKSFIHYPPLRPFLAGILLVALYCAEGSFRYAGLGISEIQRSLTEPVSASEPILKSLFTALTVGSGFKGGEFIPMVFIGSTLGSALSLIFPVSVGLLAALGFAAVFGAGANTPIACAVMAMEIFGPKIGLYSFVACFSAYYASGGYGIYSSQPGTHTKFNKIKTTMGRLGL